MPTLKPDPTNEPGIQFGLRSLLQLTAAVAIVFAIANLCIRNFPDALIGIVIVSVPLALFGVVLLVQSLFLSFSMWVTPNTDVHRRANTLNCVRMTSGGLLAVTPLAYSIFCFIKDFDA